MTMLKTRFSILVIALLFFPASIKAQQKHPYVNIAHIGKTVEGRDLEIIRIGHVNAPHRILKEAQAATSKIPVRLEKDCWSVSK